MLRHGVLSAACAARAIPRRQLSTTAPRFIRIKKPEGAEPAKPTPPPKAPEQPSPAEKPASVPPSLDAGKKFEPEVIAQNTTAEASSPGATSEPLESAVPPSEPPKPEQTKVEEPVEEFPDKPDLSKLPSLNIDPEAQVRAQEAIEQPKEDAKGKPKPGAGKKQPKYESSIDRKRRNMARLGYATLLLGVVGAAYYVGEGQGEKEGQAKEQKSFIEQFKANFAALGDIFSKPAFEVLLPDPLPPPHQRPYTLLVDLEDMLVHSSWDRQHGWRTAKRPGVDYFLGYLSQFYEIVLFSSQPSFTGLPVSEKLDPMTLYLPYKLFRENTRYVDGKVVKDIDYLNRDPRKVVMLETNPEHSHLQPDNAIIMPRWDGKAGDKGLIEMIPFLESIAIFAPQDVRPVLKHYSGKDIPREYAKKEAEQKAAAIAEWERTHPTQGSSWTGALFGGGQTRPQQPMTYLEIKRQQAQRAYEEEQKYYNEHREEFLRLIEEDKQRQLAAMKGSLFGMMGGSDAEKAQQEAAAQAAAQQAQQQQK